MVAAPLTKHVPQPEKLSSMMAESMQETPESTFFHSGINAAVSTVHGMQGEQERNRPRSCNF